MRQITFVCREEYNKENLLMRESLVKLGVRLRWEWNALFGTCHKSTAVGWVKEFMYSVERIIKRRFCH